MTDVRGRGPRCPRGGRGPGTAMSSWRPGSGDRDVLVASGVRGPRCPRGGRVRGRRCPRGGRVRGRRCPRGDRVRGPRCPRGDGRALAGFDPHWPRPIDPRANGASWRGFKSLTGQDLTRRLAGEFRAGRGSCPGYSGHTDLAACPDFDPLVWVMRITTASKSICGQDLRGTHAVLSRSIFKDMP
jgi:hypothetical protein